MRMPSRTDFADGEQFLSAINQWQAASAAGYAQLREMFDATEAVSVRPIWSRDAVHIAHVDLLGTPVDTETPLRTLASYAMERGFKIVRVCHGMFGELLRDEPVWSCFVQLQKA